MRGQWRSTGGHGNQESLDYKGHEQIKSDAGLDSYEGGVPGALLFRNRQRQNAVVESYAAIGSFAGWWNQQSSEQLQRTTLMIADI